MFTNNDDTENRLGVRNEKGKQSRLVRYVLVCCSLFAMSKLCARSDDEIFVNSLLGYRDPFTIDEWRNDPSIWPSFNLINIYKYLVITMSPYCNRCFISTKCSAQIRFF